MNQDPVLQNAPGRAGNRRSFFRSMLDDLLVCSDRINGKPVAVASNLPNLPDTVLSEIVPERLLKKTISTGDRAQGPIEQEIETWFDGTQRLRDISERLVRERSQDRMAAWQLTRSVFLTLAAKGACYPLNLPPGVPVDEP